MNDDDRSLEEGSLRLMKNARGFWLALITAAGIGRAFQAQAGVHAFRELEPIIALILVVLMAFHRISFT